MYTVYTFTIEKMHEVKMTIKITKEINGTRYGRIEIIFTAMNAMHK